MFSQEKKVLQCQSNPIFDSSHAVHDIKNRSVRGGMVTLGGQVLTQLMQLAGTMVLARLLSLREFGLVAMVTSITGFALLFKDLGLVQATIQRKDITHEQISTLFWINILISSIIMVIVMLFAPALVWYYKEPRLFSLTIVIAFSFLLGGLGVQHEALLKRNMRFGSIALREVVSTAGSVIVALSAAWLGAGVWALVFMTLAKNLFQSITVWAACGWWPGKPVRGCGVREMLAFGGHLTWFGTVNYFSRNLDQILIGRYCGADPLALYSRAYSLLTLPLRQINAPIGNVAMPAMSRLQSEPELFRKYYLKATQMIGYLTMPLIISLAVLSREIIFIVLGEQWMGAVPIFAILAFAALTQPLCNSTGWVFVASGQGARMAKWGMISSAITCASFVAGLPWGVMGVAISYTISNYLLTVYNLAYCFKNTPLKVMDVFLELKHPFLFSMILAAAMYLAHYLSRGLHPVAIMTICMFAGLLAAMILVMLWKQLRREITDLFGTLTGALKKKKNPADPPANADQDKSEQTPQSSAATSS